MSRGLGVRHGLPSGRKRFKGTHGERPWIPGTKSHLGVLGQKHSEGLLGAFPMSEWSKPYTVGKVFEIPFQRAKEHPIPMYGLGAARPGKSAANRDSGFPGAGLPPPPKGGGGRLHRAAEAYVWGRGVLRWARPR